jgi:hypothetical protein
MIATFTAVAAATLMLAIGVLADAGRWISSEQYADNMAAEAGRAAAQQIDTSVMTSGQARLDPLRAAAAARDYLNTADVDGTVTVSGDVITITTTVERDPILLSVAGLDAIRATGKATVRMATE